MYRTGQKTTDIGKVFGVFEALGMSSDGDWEVQLSTPKAGQCVLVDDAEGSSEGMKISPENYGCTKLVVRNQEVYVKNCAVSSVVVSLLVFQV